MDEVELVVKKLQRSLQSVEPNLHPDQEPVIRKLKSRLVKIKQSVSLDERIFRRPGERQFISAWCSGCFNALEKFLSPSSRIDGLHALTKVLAELELRYFSGDDKNTTPWSMEQLSHQFSLKMPEKSPPLFHPDAFAVKKDVSSDTLPKHDPPENNIMSAWFVTGEGFAANQSSEIGFKIGAAQLDAFATKKTDQLFQDNLKILISLHSHDLVECSGWQEAILKTGAIEPVYFMVIPKNQACIRLEFCVYRADSLLLLEKLAAAMPCKILIPS